MPWCSPTKHACVSDAQLRIAVAAPAVRRVLESSRLDRPVSIYPSAEAAVAAGTPGVIPLLPRPGPGRGEGQVGSRRRGRTAPEESRAGITPGMLWGLVDGLDDGVILSNEDGVLVLANQRAEAMFGYRPGDLLGQPVESLVPGDFRAEHISLRSGYANSQWFTETTMPATNAYPSGALVPKDRKMPEMRADGDSTKTSGPRAAGAGLPAGVVPAMTEPGTQGPSGGAFGPGGPGEALDVRATAL